MDIRNFFPVKSSNGSSKARAEKDIKSKKPLKPPPTIAKSTQKMNTRKRAVVLSDSDSEDPLPKPKTTKRRIIEDDDDNDDDVVECFEPKKSKKNEPPKVVRQSPRKSSKEKPKDSKPQPTIKENKKEEKPLEVSKFFGKIPVDRSTKHLVEKKPKLEKADPKLEKDQPKKLELSDDEFQIEDDEEFERTLAQLDMPGSSTNSNLIESVQSSQENPKSANVTVNGLESLEKIEDSKIDKDKIKSPDTKGESKSKIKEDIIKSKLNGHRMKEVEIKTTESKMEKKIVKEEDMSILDTTLNTPENKKRENFLNYQRFLYRDGPTALGSKEIPEGADCCLEGKTFLLTGVLESIERDDTKQLIEKYKGKVMSTLSKNTNYIVVGRDAGPAKLEKAEKFGTKRLDEDELFDLIRNAPPGKSAKKTMVNGSRKISPNEKPKASKTKDEVGEKFKPLSESSLEDSLKENVEVQEKAKPSKAAIKKTTEIYQESKTLSSPTKVTVTDSLMWVDKHKPQALKQVIGQQGDRSNAKKLVQWLKDWQKNRSMPKKAPSRWGGGGNDEGASFRAALLSGSPGIGKTTTAQLACKELGFTYFELNASDTRSKRSLHDEVSQLLQNTTITGLAGNQSLNSTKHVIIMDEVDGMSGNQDRGGTQELIALIKTSKIPIICICNDRMHQKIRSLSNYCFDLRFQKPRLEQIKASVMSICYKEGIKIPSDILNDIITASSQDVRQVLHNVFLWSARSLSACVTDEEKKKPGQTKDIKLGPFEVLKKVFASDEEKSTIHDKASLFFHDYSLSPLFVQENYIQVQPKNARGNQLEHLKLLSRAADSIRDGDTVDRVIRTSNNWSLLPTQAIFSSVIPGDTMRGYLSQMITFPSWLGKNSTKNHMDRVLQQLQMHMRLRISGNKTELNTQYIPLLHHKVTNPLVEKETDGVKEVIETMENYFLLREDLEIITELALWSGKTDPMSKVNPKVKGALTRTFNKESFLIPYSMNTFKKGKKASLNELDEEGEGEESVVNEENEQSEDDDITSDPMVKQKKATKTLAKSEDKPSTSKGKGKGKTSKKK